MTATANQWGRWSIGHTPGEFVCNSGGLGTSSRVHNRLTPAPLGGYFSEAKFGGSPGQFVATTHTWRQDSVFGRLHPGPLYWVGGTDNWDNTGSKWSASSGGAASTLFPLLGINDAIFDANSGSGVVTLGPVFPPTSFSRDFNTTGFAGTFAAEGFLFCGGNVTKTVENPIYYEMCGFGGSYTFSVAGHNIESLVFLSMVSPSSWTINANVVSDSLIYFQNNLDGVTIEGVNATVTFNNVDVTALAALWSNPPAADVRTVNMGSGTWNFTWVDTASNDLWDASHGNLTLSASTSKIKFSGNSSGDKVFKGGGRTYNDFENDTNGTGIVYIYGANTWNTFDIAKTNDGRFTRFEAVTSTVASFKNTAGTGHDLNHAAGGSFVLSDSAGTNALTGTTISNSTVQGGATWNAYTVNGNVDGGGNSGWNFTSPAVNADAAETIALTDTPSAIATFVGNASESIALSDSPTVIATLNVAPSESVALVDTPSAVQTTSQSVAESIALVDSPSVIATLNVAPSESVALVDSPSVVATLNVAPSESIALVDSPSVIATLNVAPSETIALVDSPTGDLVTNQSAAETIALVDSPDALLVLGGVGSETLALVDSPSSVVVAPVSTAESLALVDSPSGAIVASPSVSESIALVESSSVVLVADGSTSESLSLVDAPSAVATFVVVVAEALSLTETQTADSGNDGTGLETIALVDSPSSSADYVVATSEALSLADSPSAAQTSSRSGDESLLLIDLPSAVASAAASAIEAMSLSDSPSAAATYAVDVAEALSLVDSCDAPTTFDPLAEAMSLADSPSATVDYAVAIEEFISLQEQQGIPTLADVAETLSFFDSASGSLIIRTRTIATDSVKYVVGHSAIALTTVESDDVPATTTTFGATP